MGRRERITVRLMATQNDPLDYFERLPFCNYYNDSSYVLDFSSAKSDEFCVEVVGYSLLERFQLSKGKSLEAFLAAAPREESIRLLDGLIRYEEGCGWSETDARRDLKNKLAEIRERTSNVAPTDELRGAGFTSAYVENLRK